MADPRQTLGAVPCLCCGQAVPVKAKKNDAGKITSISFSCPWCDFPAYAKEGTEAFRRTMAKLPPVEQAAPTAPAAPAAAEKQTPPAAEKAKPRIPLFG